MKSKTARFLDGTVKRHPDGYGFFIPDDSRHPDVYIPSSKIGSALTNDKVRVLVRRKRRGGPRSHFGFVHSILKRDKSFAIGFFATEGGKTFIKKHNLGYPANILINNPKEISVRNGDCVKAKICFHSKNHFSFQGELVENFGPIGSLAKDDLKRVMAENNIPFNFPEEVLKETERLPEEVRQKDYSDRIDLRDRAFITIDGATAQDFDDAVFVEKLSNGYRLYVAVADVSHYVLEDSLLDREAFERGNSSYFPNFCIPMLPEKLSHDLCSLKAHKDRLVMVLEMDFDLEGNRVRDKVYPSVINSRQRLTYGQTQDILDDLSLLKGEFLASLKAAKSLAQILINRHVKENQGLNLNIPETLILVDARGETQDIVKEKRLFSHLMIEQFMLSANQAASAFLEKKNIPLIYRIHESPEEEKLKSLQKFSKVLGFSQSFQSRNNFIRFLTQYKDHRQSDLIHKLALRSLPQARYGAFNKGHYGLNFSSYTHFTSPIRRYCDLVIHRLIKRALSGNLSSGLPLKELEKQAEFISQREQNSVKAERQIKDIKKARFLKQHVGQSFSGYVSSISSFGLFIMIKPFEVEGLVRFQDLKGGWGIDEFQLIARNKRSAYQIQFGDEVKVLITASHVLTGQVNLKLLSHKDRKIKARLI